MPRKKRTQATSRSKSIKKVVYLLGAGATHAELSNLCADKISDANFLEKNSLLLAAVSKRVCRDAKRSGEFAADISNLLSPAGLTNIELFISLLEENRISSAAQIAQKLKDRIKKDILARLKNRQEHFYLHKALFELHKKNKDEELIGVISLNYDDLVDEAYESILGKVPNYCLSIHSSERAPIPLLKLHGGFNLIYRDRPLPIITPGVYKNYLALPYSFMWGRALELLMDCDILRIIGCSLSQNDLGVIDLLFKAHISRNEPIVVQLIDFDPDKNRVKEQFGFFPSIEPALEIEGRLIADVSIKDPTTGSNPFKIWLKAKIERMMKKLDIRKTKYLRKVLV